jgi:hypothetical protein
VPNGISLLFESLAKIKVTDFLTCEGNFAENAEGDASMSANSKY